MKYKKYSSYKDSELEWLGKIPSEWSNSKLKYHSFVYNGNSISDNEKENYENLDITSSIPYVSTKDIDSNFLTIDYDNGMRVPICNDKFKIAKKDSTLICIEGGSAGKKLSFLDKKVCFVNKLACIDSYNGLNKRFSNYILRSSIFNYLFNLSTTGLIPGVSINQLKDFEIILPSIKEQQQIANFLDKAIAKIDTLIEKQTKQIELLKEKRQAVISHAVTKGINPNVPMKDSGVDWLGKIPEHWEIVQSRRLFKDRKERAKVSDEQLTASQKYGVIYQKEYMELEARKVTLVLTGSEILKHVEKGDFVISMRSFQGGLELCKYSGSVSSAYIGLIPIKHVFHDYFKYLFKSITYIQALQSTSNLVRDGQALRFENFSQVDLLIVPFNEQQQIANYLDDKTSKIDTLIEKSNKSIELLKEKRTALISACVTGKIDVRELV